MTTGEGCEIRARSKAKKELKSLYKQKENMERILKRDYNSSVTIKSHP